MRGLTALLMLAGSLMCAGCFTTGVTDAPPPPGPIPKLPPPVTADQITPQTARYYLQVMSDELNREEQQLRTGAPPR